MKPVLYISTILLTLGLLASCSNSVDMGDPKPNVKKPTPTPLEPKPNDADGDGILDENDNCPTLANTDQADENGNDVGDVCEGLECSANLCTEEGILEGYLCDSGKSVQCAIDENGCIVEDARLDCLYGCGDPSPGRCSAAPPRSPTDPVISETSGSKSHGSELTISGTEFGSHGFIDDIWWLGGDDGWIETNSIGTSPWKLDPVTRELLPNAVPNTTRIYKNQGGNDAISSEDQWSGSKSLNLKVDPEAGGGWESTWAYKYPKPGGFRKIFASFWYKIDIVRFPIKYDTDGNPLWPQHKFLRITSDTYEGCGENIDPLRTNNESLNWGYRLNDTYGFDLAPAVMNFGNLGCGGSDFLYENAEAVGYTKVDRDYLWTRLDRGGEGPSSKYNFDFGEWNRVDVWVDHGTWDNSNGYTRIKIVKPNGPHAGSQIGQEYRNVQHLNSGSSCLRCFPASERDSFVWYMLFGVTSVGDPNRPSVQPIVNNFIDDPYIQTGTQARVELGNMPNYEECSKLEMQKPSSWTPSEIKITLNQGGSFSSGDTAYLFVIGEDGTVSPGFPITLE